MFLFFNFWSQLLQKYAWSYFRYECGSLETNFIVCGVFNILLKFNFIGILLEGEHYILAPFIVSLAPATDCGVCLHCLWKQQRKWEMKGLMIFLFPRHISHLSHSTVHVFFSFWVCSMPLSFFPLLSVPSFSGLQVLSLVRQNAEAAARRSSTGKTLSV